MANLPVQYSKAARLYNERKMRDALAAANQLISDGDASGYYIAGGVYEYGGDGLDRDLDKALDAYEKAREKCKYAEAQLGAARVLLRKGGRQNVAKAMSYCEQLLVLAPRTKAISYMTLARIHEKYSDPPDIPNARKLYLKAGFLGLASAFREYARVEYMFGSKLLGRILYFLVAILISPLMRLFIGKKTNRYK